LVVVILLPNRGVDDLNRNEETNTFEFRLEMMKYIRMNDATGKMEGDKEG